MRFLVLSDMHNDDVFIHQLKEEFKKADGVIFGGDFAKYGQPETAEPPHWQKHDPPLPVPFVPEKG